MDKKTNIGWGLVKMSKHLERDLRSLEKKLLLISARVEDMIKKACRALRERRSDLAREVIDSDDAVDALEVEIEEDCLKILALHQPVAVDLRRTATVLKINNDLERIADLAANIAERGARLIVFSDFAIPESMEKMAEKAVKMVHAALDSFVKMDADAARQVRGLDDAIDDMNVQAIAELCRVMQHDSSTVEPALHCFSASRQIERIADHATNIAEDVIYLVEGEIARHKHDDLSPVRASRLPATP